MIFLEQVSYHQSGRPIFYVDDKCPCLGSGVLFYVALGGHVYFLMQQEIGQKKYSFCDLGGKTDKVDSNIIETAIREVMEETNGVLFQQLFESSPEMPFSSSPKLRDHMANFFRLFSKQKPHFIYNRKSKYLLALMELDPKYLKAASLPKHNTITVLHQQFGDKEYECNIPRHIIWMNLSYFSTLLKDKKMHIRLKDTKMYQYLNVLQKKFC